MSMAIRIAFFQLCFFGVMAWVVSTGIFSASVTNNLNMDQTSAQLKDTLPTDTSYTPTTITTFIFGDFLRMVKTLFFLLSYTLFPVFLFAELGISSAILNLLAMMCTVVYAIGLMEYIANRKVEPQ